MAKSDIQVAKDSFSATIDGVPYAVNKGERVREGHPLLKGREALFEPVDLKVHYDIEQATAAPGERRGQPPMQAPPAPAPSAPAAPATPAATETKAADYSDLKRPQLLELLEQRNIEAPKGMVANTVLVDLLKASDAE